MPSLQVCYNGKASGDTSQYGQGSPISGDDRLRRERLVPECEPRGAELVNSAQKIKCQSHFLRCYAPRCISDDITAVAPRRHASAGTFLRRVTDRAKQWWSAAYDATTYAKDQWLVAESSCRTRPLRRQTSTDYARRFPRVESFGRGFNSRHLHQNLFGQQSNC
jgi:hypothetical protein